MPRITLPRTRCLGKVRTHASSLSKTDARWLKRPATGSARLNSAILRVRRRERCRTRRRSLSRTHYSSRGRAHAAHAASIARSYVCADAVVATLETVHVIARDRGHTRQTRAAHARANAYYARDCARRRTRCCAGIARSFTPCLEHVLAHAQAGVGQSPAPLSPLQIPHAHQPQRRPT